MDKQDDFQFDELKDLLDGVSKPDDLDLDAIIAEVNGDTVSAQPEPKPSKPAPAPEHKAPKETRPEPEHKAPKETKPEPEHKTPKETKPEPEHKAPKETKPEYMREEPPKVAPETQRAAAVPETEIPDLSAFEQESEADPRQARRQAREERVAARRARAEARRQAALEEEAAEQREAEEAAQQETVETADTPRKPARDHRRLSKSERLEREMEEEDEEIELRDPEQAQRAFLGRTRGLTVRSLFVLLLAFAAAYLSIAPSLDILPLPALLDFNDNPNIVIGGLLLLQFVALFLAIDVFGLGFYNLFSLHPDRATLVSLAVVATLVHGATIIVFGNESGTDLPYVAVSMLMLYASMREERNRFAARFRAYRTISQVEQPMALYSHFDSNDDACRAVKGPLVNMEYFEKELERPDTIDRFSMIYTPIVLAAAVILSLIASFGRGEPMRFFWAFSALMCISAPLGLICAFGASYKNVSRKLLSMGAAISGARQANILRGTEEVVLTESELFPAGSISLEAIENMGVVSDERILAMTAAMAEAVDLELGHVLATVAEEKGAPSMIAREVHTTEGGLVGEISGSRVIFGTAALMVQMGLRIRPQKSEDEKSFAYLVVENRLAGVLTLRYVPTKNTYRAMRTMRRMHMNVALAVRDFNISPAMVETLFDLRRGFADQPDPKSTENILSSSYTQADAPAAILTREGAGPMVQVLRCADKMAGAVRSNVVLGTFAGICGMGIAFYLVLVNSYSALAITNLLLYLVLWYVPAFLITQQTH